MSPGVIVDRADVIGCDWAGAGAGAAGVGIEVPEVTLVEDTDGHYHLYTYTSFMDHLSRISQLHSNPTHAVCYRPHATWCPW